MRVKLLVDYTPEEKRVVIQGLVDKFTKSNEREPAVKRELADDTMSLSKITEMITNGEPMPADSPYESLEAWEESISKEILTSQKSLAKIEEQKVEIEGLQYYLDNNPVAGK